MPLPESGPISMGQIAGEFGGAAPHSISEYYGAAAGIPASGQISMSQFHGKRAGPPPGQVVFTSVSGNTFSWAVPDLVTSISMVVVQPGGTYSSASVRFGSVIVCSAAWATNRVGDGGGDGGYGGAAQYDAFGYPYGSSGGGGAGGYSGKGGNQGQNGSGGGGGGGGWGGQFNTAIRNGGGVGLLGQGANGAAGASDGGVAVGQGGPGSGGTGVTYGGGGGAQHAAGQHGGALSYKNNVTVTPGQVVSIYFSPTAGSGPGAVRIMWGGDRSYPNNAGDM